MKLVLDSFWRAALYCLRPQVVALSFLPLVLMVALSFGLGYWFWESAVDAVALWLADNELLSMALGWLDQVGAGALRTVLSPLLVLGLATPLIVLLSLLLVGVMMVPAMVHLVAQRRFPELEKRRGASLWASLGWSLWSTVLALLALLASLPLWLVPPLVMVLPPLIWGWLSYRVFAFDALAEHASADERRQLLAHHRTPLLVLGVVSGYLGAMPSVLWASGAMFIAMAPVLIPLAIWLYTLIFAFSALWFTHYALAALAAWRHSGSVQPPGFAAARAAVLSNTASGPLANLTDVTDLSDTAGSQHPPHPQALPPPAKADGQSAHSS